MASNYTLQEQRQYVQSGATDKDWWHGNSGCIIVARGSVWEGMSPLKCKAQKLNTYQRGLFIFLYNVQ